MTRRIDDTHRPELKSWVESANQSGTDFPIQNLPFGVFRPRGSHVKPRIGVAIGDQILDVLGCADLGLLRGLGDELLQAIGAPVLNPLMALGKTAALALRHRLSTILTAGEVPVPAVLVAMGDAEMLLPAAIGDYSDFYASIFHATNVGRLFRPDHPLLPNYNFVPIAYHGRASSIVPSGTPVFRPWGQRKSSSTEPPEFAPTRALDYELEVAALIGPGNALGEPIALDAAEDHIFGLCLLNDWSARDIQAWESQPLGPFLSKSFASTISPWVITLEALAPFRASAFERRADDPQPLPHLRSAANQLEGSIDLTLEAAVHSMEMRRAGLQPMRLSRSTLREMYWTFAQMVAHHTSNGCNLRAGDVIGSGTVSGSHDDSSGCLLELTRQGTQPFVLPTGQQRSYLDDGDEVVLRGSCERDGFVRIGFGECVGRVVEQTFRFAPQSPRQI
jgi:fumarylacetoacetase